ncbi:MAG: AglZ/HisF2 family acetamidino modification protein [Bacteroidota bacterium]
MLQTRVIPVLLLKNKGLVKTVQFKNETYIGDPINAVKIFNDKEVDELVFLDIDASKNGTEPNIPFLQQICTECFMPISYGGGVRTLDMAKILFKIGIEKLIFNTLLFESPNVVTDVSNYAGSSSVIASIDLKKNMWGKFNVFSHSGKDIRTKDPIAFAKETENMGAGEIMVNVVDNDGMMNGYALDIIQKITSTVAVPVIACGGAKDIEDFKKAVRSAGASAVAAGSMFVFYGKHKAVLINYPDRSILEKELI